VFCPEFWTSLLPNKERHRGRLAWEERKRTLTRKGRHRPSKGMPMSRKVSDEMLPRLRQRDAGRGREGRSRLIDEVCEHWGYSRKHAIKLLGAKAGWGGDPAVRKGRPPTYGPPSRGGAVADLAGGRTTLRQTPQGPAAGLAAALRSRTRNAEERPPRPGAGHQRRPHRPALGPAQGPRRPPRPLRHQKPAAC
jgi:hypothetical protein